MPSLRDELKQSKPFVSAEQEAMLGIVRTAARLEHAMENMLKPHGITGTQYNVLRILRGAGDGGLCRFEIGERMVTQVPDVTRLLDRLEQMKLIVRERGTVDRRRMTTRITRAGLDLLARLDDPVDRFNRRALGHLTKGRLKLLSELLDEARDGI